MKIGRITLLDPTAPNGSVDKYGVENERVIGKIFEEPAEFVRLIATNSDELRAGLLRLCDEEKCPLVVTNGGVGASRRDITPETTLQVLDKELPGFGEIMRYYSYERLPTAILSRAVAGIRGGSLVINLPSRPKAVKACLYLLREAMAEGLEQITGIRYALFVDPITVPLEKYLPFLSWLKPKHPTAIPEQLHPDL